MNISKPENILVSIILSESTTSLLGLNTPNIEELSAKSGTDYVFEPIQIDDIFQEKTNFLEYILGKRNEVSKGKDSGIVSADLAYFSDTSSINSDSDDDIDGDYFENPMEPVIVYTRPLVTVKTLAHENNLNGENNKIYISVQNEEISMVDSEWICRICHGGDSLGDLLSPCRCRGTIALAHIECLEHWLRESSNSHCELCNHHFQIIREPKYNVPWSILVYLTQPGENWKDMLFDFVSFILYTPSAFTCTYMLMLVCENVARMQLRQVRNISGHFVTFSAVLGMAAIDFTYSSWLIITLQKHTNAWKSWCRNNSYLKLVLPEWKKRPYKKEVVKIIKATVNENE